MTDSPFAITPTDLGFAVTGEIDAYTAPAIAAAIASSRLATIELDMSGVEFVDSSGLRVVIEAHQQLLDNGGSLILVRPSPVVQRLFDISGVHEYLNIAE